MAAPLYASWLAKLAEKLLSMTIYIGAGAGRTKVAGPFFSFSQKCVERDGVVEVRESRRVAVSAEVREWCMQLVAVALVSVMIVL